MTSKPLTYINMCPSAPLNTRSTSKPLTHINMCPSAPLNTRSTSTNKLIHIRSNNNYTRNFYFNRLLYHSLILTSHYQPLNLPSINTCNNIIFKNNFASDIPCTYHFCCRCSNCYNLRISSNFSVM